MSGRRTEEPPRTRAWVSEPETPDRSIVEATGRHWEEWVDLIDAGPGREAGHTAIAAWVQSEHGLGGWWGQGVVVGYERITGIRAPGQMPDGTFSISRSKILDLPADGLRDAIVDDATRSLLVPGYQTALRSRPGSKAPRFSLADASGEPLGAILVTLDPAPKDRVRVTVTHEKLPSAEAGAAWKEHWGGWLDGLDEAFRALRR
ncbi:DUF4287 domain-containing protein [Herbiconiux sp. CPCC 203407]|uniref:DUF4287 domain-containing protein n=1 Tax=Herbiconiux oxytropis TaxID=2970915 RepID=A0AA41XJG5_9MICO|nr:DUF4287 domain-containing protein [Herbiconiux oxytropis]MCS5722536.1 DUF4287 domain-containing protein [Herbiconiux oxytropis]MCS5726476.1 DUF4287 domain-containing protein [Herbiconiux oxytropis]